LKHLLDRANEYALELADIPGWRNAPRAYADIESHLQAGEVFVVRGGPNGAVSSTITLLEKPGSEWTDAGLGDGSALYFAKFMKDPDTAADEEAHDLLRFAVDEAVRRGKTAIRCDTVTDTPHLVDYYKKLGFEERGRFIYDSSDREGVLLEANIEALENQLPA
jgi:ribosomal protein S18 acetylase RimI-like enzyme